MWIKVTRVKFAFDKLSSPLHCWEETILSNSQLLPEFSRVATLAGGHIIWVRMWDLLEGIAVIMYWNYTGTFNSIATSHITNFHGHTFWHLLWRIDKCTLLQRDFWMPQLCWSHQGFSFLFFVISLFTLEITFHNSINSQWIKSLLYISYKTYIYIYIKKLTMPFTADFLNRPNFS